MGLRILRQKQIFMLTLLIFLNSMLLLPLINVNSPKNQTSLINYLANLPINSSESGFGPFLIWNTTWGGPSTDDGYGVAVDASGAIYCVGSTSSFGAGGTDLLLVKFFSNGTKAWQTTWGGPYNDEGYGVAVDATGAIYCVGYTCSFGAGWFDLVLLKFFSNGTKAWNTTWGGNWAELGYGIALDATGAIYCVGYTPSPMSYDILVLLKFFSNGTLAWQTGWGYLIGYNRFGVAVDATGAIYCVGSCSGAENSDLALLKFFSNGTKAWQTTWGGSNSDYGYGVAVDATGAIYCIGSTYRSSIGYDLFLVKFNTDGTKAWYSTWGGPNPDYGQGVAVGATGAIYCVGYTNSSGAGGSDLVLLKFFSNGTLAGQTTWGGSNNDYGYGVAVDATGDIYCVGSTFSFGAGDSDFALLQFYRNIPLVTPILDPISPNPNSDGLIELNWTEVVGATQYYVYRSSSNITSVTDLVPIDMVFQSAYQDKIIINQTFYYVIIAGNLEVNSSLSNCESVVVEIIDVAPPNYFNEKLSLSSPQYYTPSQLYQFNITLIDNLIVDYVVFQWDNNNYTVNTYVKNEYYYQFRKLGVGTHEYRWFFRDSVNNWNASTLKFYIINRNPGGLDILLNGTSNDYEICWGQYCNITLSFPIEDTLYFYLNGTIINIQSAPLINISRYTQIGIYNITAYYAGNQNYTAMVLTRWLAVIWDIKPPQMIHFPNIIYLNCTLLEYYHSGLRVAINVTDNVLVRTVILCENSTGNFVNRSITNSNGHIYWIDLSIEELQYGDNLAYFFYAEDTSNNWGINGNLTNIYLLKIHDFINPSGCTISHQIFYWPNFISENSIFIISGGYDFGGSGIDHFEFNWDSGPWSNGTIVSCLGVPNGIHNLFYRAIDLAGNTGVSQNITIYLLANEADYDNDRLTNFAEIFIYKTNALDPDSDGDGITDGDEILLGANPLDPANPLIGRILLMIELIAAIIVSAVIIIIAKYSKKPLSSSKKIASLNLKIRL